MEVLARSNQPTPKRHSTGVRVMVLTDHPDGQTASRLASYGSLVEAKTALPAALTAVINDRIGYDLFVMECDPFGGIPAAEKAIAALIAAEARMRVILISAEFDTPAYPLGRRTAVCLPKAGSDHAFRTGFDHVLRDQKVQQLM